MHDKYHIDHKYKENVSTTCGLPICCQDVSYSSPPTTALSGYWGSFGVPCDIPPRLSESLHKWFSTQNKPDFVINTGDDPAHDVWAQSKDDNIKAMQTVVSHHMLAFNNTPLFCAIGNHEYFPVDVARGSDADNWLYGVISDAYDNWLPNDATKTLKSSGFYTARARPGLRIISLNTLTLCPDSFFSGGANGNNNWPDPEAQMAWLNNSLLQAKNLNESVILLSHHPVDDWTPSVSTSFKNIISQFPGLIKMQLFGHVHMNDFSIQYYNNNTPAFVAFTGGSLTTTGVAENNNVGCGLSGNPGFTVYIYNRTSFDILDIEYWWTDLREANTKMIDPIWKKQYSAKESYNMNKMDPSSWENIIYQISKNDTLKTIYTNIWNMGLSI